MTDLKALFRTIHLGIWRANRLFTRWTGGWWLQAYGVEGFVVAQVASAIMRPGRKNRPAYLTLETPFSDLYTCRKEPHGKKSVDGCGRKRADMALYHEDGTLACVIEFKRYWVPGCFADLDRLAQLYMCCGKERGGPLENAVFAQLVAVGVKHGKGNVERYFKTLEERCAGHMAEHHGLGLRMSRGTAFYKPMVSPGGTQVFSSFCAAIRS